MILSIDGLKQREAPFLRNFPYRGSRHSRPIGRARLITIDGSCVTIADACSIHEIRIYKDAPFLRLRLSNLARRRMPLRSATMGLAACETNNV